MIKRYFAAAFFMGLGLFVYLDIKVLVDAGIEWTGGSAEGLWWNFWMSIGLKGIAALCGFGAYSIVVNTKENPEKILGAVVETKTDRWGEKTVKEYNLGDNKDA